MLGKIHGKILQKKKKKNKGPFVKRKFSAKVTQDGKKLYVRSKMSKIEWGFFEV